MNNACVFDLFIINRILEFVPFNKQFRMKGISHDVCCLIEEQLKRKHPNIQNWIQSSQKLYLNHNKLLKTKGTRVKVHHVGYLGISILQYYYHNIRLSRHMTLFIAKDFIGNPYQLISFESETKIDFISKFYPFEFKFLACSDDFTLAQPEHSFEMCLDSLKPIDITKQIYPKHRYNEIINMDKPYDRLNFLSHNRLYLENRMMRIFDMNVEFVICHSSKFKQLRFNEFILTLEKGRIKRIFHFPDRNCVWIVQFIFHDQPQRPNIFALLTPHSITHITTHAQNLEPVFHKESNTFYLYEVQSVEWIPVTSISLDNIDNFGQIK